MSKGPRPGYDSEDLAEKDELHESLLESCEGSLESSFSSPMSESSSLKVKELRKSFENLLNPTLTDNIGVPAEALKKLKGSRSAYKGRITRVTNALDKAKTESTLDRVTFKVKYDELKGYLDKYNAVDGEVSNLYDEHDVDFDDAGRKKDREESDAYLDSISDVIIKFEKHVVTNEQKPVQNDNEALINALAQSQGGPGRQPISCQLFDGTNDKADFLNWFSQFETMINSQRAMQDKYKLISLRNHLTKGGLAFKMIYKLQLNDENYQTAIDLLKEEFLDEPKLIDDLFKELLEKTPSYDAEFKGLRIYIAEIKGLISDLQTAHKVDLSIVDSAGYKFVSHIIFSKIFAVIQKELISKCQTNYPTMDNVFDNIKEAIKTYLKTKVKKPEPNKVANVSNWKPNGSSMDGGSKGGANSGTLDNFHTKTGPVVFHCRFCDVQGHSSLYCSKYKTLDERKKRCEELKLCFKCTSNKHLQNTCPGKSGKLKNPCRYCNSYGHIAALCHNVNNQNVQKGSTRVDACFTTGVNESLLLLPIINLRLRGHDGRSRNFNFLFDTASQRSYISQRAFDSLGCNPKLVSNVEFDVRTFLGSSKKSLKEVNVDVFTGQYRHYGIIMLVDRQFDINFSCNGLGQAVSNIKDKGYRLAAEYEGDSVTVHGLIGVDIIQYIKPNQVINCLNGSAFATNLGIIPFGNVNQFLYSNQINQVNSQICKVNSQIKSHDKTTHNNFANLINKFKCPSTMVNFVMKPSLSYDDPFESFFDESLVERRIDKMISCDSLGIDESKENLSDYDKIRVQKFRDGIELINGEYHVELVYHDNIDKVQSNYNVALNVMDRVYKKLSSKNQYDEYVEQFKNFENENIIEKIEVSPKDFKNHIWIPHRPVFKTDDQSTTKMRPVFNASLKTKKGTPSLNEASYCGVNLMKDMNELLMLFRTNHYVYLSDIRKAFLMIKLKKTEDRNRFCFFLREGDKLVCYRFTTIIFGFVASPFILNYVIQYHASLFPNDECTEILKNNFFVDNLVKTHNSEDKLMYFYQTSVERMAKGGFDLRSCNTNSSKVKQQMIKDKKYVEHGCTYEKVLGYMYSPNNDILKLAKSNIDLMLNLITKRIILSQNSKVFDPLGFASPVTVRGKILISSLWQKKQSDDHWDERVDEESGKAWIHLAKDLEGLSDIKFPRYSLSEGEQTDLYLFSDASKQAYGFVAYAVQNGKSGFICSKTKVAPVIKKSLPTLELLGVFLTLKNLFSMLSTFKKVNVENVYIATDSQVVLSWLLADIVKTKNGFACNRIKDCHKMFGDLQKQFNIKIQYKYVPTKENPGDLLTRGLSLQSFRENLNFWLYGPNWIQSLNVVWPNAELKCLTKENQSLVLCTVNTNDQPVKMLPIVPFDRYSKINKLIGVTATMLSYLNKRNLLKDQTLISLWDTSDTWQCAKVHLLKVMQANRFSDEIEYLKDPKGKAPTLVNDLDLFLDDLGLLRSAGRTGKVQIFDYDIINPIILAKDHPLTSLIVNEAHINVQHLGISSTLTKVRMGGYWIPKSRQAVKNVISTCLMCKRFNSLSFRYPKITNLPKHRVNLVKPYMHTGIDFTGEIKLREQKGDKFKRMYILIFTCLQIRAVHIELVPDMDTKSLVLAIIRFTNLYGVPSHIYSDNAKSFIAGVDIMKEVFKASDFQEKFSKHNIKHIRIPAYSAWVGSVWERMIGVLKSCLYKVVGRSAIGYFKLLTILSDIENAVNSRPLTYRCSGDSSVEIITPNCFLKPYVDNSLLFKSESENLLASEPPCRKQVVKTLEHREYLLKQFKELWYQEYLVSLRETCKDLHEISFENKVKVNDVVLVKGPPMTKRPFWQFGRVVELIPGYDQKVRAVKILKGDGATGTITTHSLKHLYPLELSLTHAHQAMEPQVMVPSATAGIVVGSAEPDSIVPSATADIVVGSAKPDSIVPAAMAEHNVATLEPVVQDLEANRVHFESQFEDQVPDSVENVPQGEININSEQVTTVTSRRSRRVRPNTQKDFYYY